MIISIPGIVCQGGGAGGFPAKGGILNDYTWEEISLVSRAGLASEYWSVGDRKGVTINGTVGSLSLNGTYYCYIIGFNHNGALEGDNLTHFQFGCSALSGGVSTAFVDSGYNTMKTSSKWFIMSSAFVNAGGWHNSSMRRTICPAFKNALSDDLQTVIKTVTKYSDNQGGGSNAASDVSTTKDEIFLLAEYEVFGNRVKANSAEQNYQQQYEWYADGNSTIKYKHDNTGSTAYWSLRSCVYNRSDEFACVSTSGTASSNSVTTSLGFAPCFCV